MVVWIEISVMRLPLLFWSVTTCVVVWIEIFEEYSGTLPTWVTTCVVVWIEICKCVLPGGEVLGHHLRGGVD